MTIKILTDGSTDIPQNIVEDLDIKIIPIHIRIGDKDYIEGTTYTTDELYEMIQDSTEIVSTTQPTPGEFAKSFIDEAENASGIICILTSNKFTKMSENAKNVIEKLSLSCPIEVVDSKSVSSGTGLIVTEVARYAKSGKSFDECVNYAKELAEKVNVAIVFDNIEALEKSGRLGKGGVFTRTAIDVKPVIEIKDGEFSPILQARTRTKALEKLNEIIDKTQDIEEIYVTFNTRANEALNFANSIKSVPSNKITINRLNAGIGLHSGPGTLGVAIRKA